jgi:hypothetical protein
MRIWKQIKMDNSIDNIEHPLTGILIPKLEFEKEFGIFLDELDGTTASDYFDFYFARCPCNTTGFKFRDDDSKEDFVNACIDLKLIPTLAETHQGETYNEKDIRKSKSSQDLLKDFKSLKTKEINKKLSTSKTYISKIDQVKSTYDKLMAALDDPSIDSVKKIELEAKLNRVIAMMEHSM